MTPSKSQAIPPPRPKPTNNARTPIAAHEGVARVGSRTQARALPFHTPEAMLDVVMAGKPNFDLTAMADTGKAFRASAHNTACSRSINFPELPAQVTPERLVDALSQIEVGHMVRARIQPTAVFDFDNTLAKGEVFFDFSQLLMQADAFPKANARRCALLLERATEGAIPADSLAHLSTGEVVTMATRMAHEGNLSLGAAFYVYVCAMTGIEMRTLNAMADHLFKEGVAGTPYKANAFPGAHEIVSTLKERGVTPHIVTMGLAFIPRAGARYLGIEPKNVHGFELEVVDGKVTGRAVDVRSVGKHRMCDAKLPSQPLFAFGDSYDSDTPLLLRASARAFVVDPNRAMRDFMAAHPTDYTWLSMNPTRTD